MKVKTLIKLAIMEVTQSRYEPNDSELVDGLRYLNRMMAKFRAKSIDFGNFNFGLDSDLTIPRQAYLGVLKNLAVSLWPQYNSDEMNPVLKMLASQTYKSLQNLSIKVGVSPFPNTLPTGYDAGYYADYYEYPEKIDKYKRMENVRLP